MIYAPFQPFEQPADDLDMEACTCGARPLENAAWCPVCLKVPVDRDDLIEELHDTFRKTTWSTPKRFTQPSPPPVYSRWRAGPRSFGLATKIVITVAILAFTVSSAQGFGFFFIGPLIVLAVVLLRATWSCERIR